jgi:hypothetical protein
MNSLGIGATFQIHYRPGFLNKQGIELKTQASANMKTPLNQAPRMGAFRRRIEAVFSPAPVRFRPGQNFSKELFL